MAKPEDHLAAGALLLDLGQLLTMSHAEVACFYDTGSWAIDDLIRLLERIADETGAEENGGGQ